MKANKAPEKLYFGKGDLAIFDIYSGRESDDEIEYTRTDALIEKACDWLFNVSIEDMTYKYNDFDTSEGWYKFIENFKKYMEE